MRWTLRARTRRASDERGIALPLALLGLISVSLLVTTALVTSSTELAISSAHRDATADLYAAEGGLQAYVAENGPALMADAGRTLRYRPPGGGEGEAVDVSVLYLGQHALAGGQGTLRLFRIVASPAGRQGRTVAAMVKQVVPEAGPLTSAVKSAITLGGDLDVNGNAFTVSGRFSGCGSPGVQAVRHAQDSQIAVSDETHWARFQGTDGDGAFTEGRGAVVNSGLTQPALAREALGLAEGQTLDRLVDRVPASHRWGPRFSPPGGPPRVFAGGVDPGEHVAVVDAAGGAVALRGGRGLLIVVNGNLDMTGNATFDGIIIVEGSFVLKGTPTVTGALISLDEEGENQIELDSSAIANGHITVQYDRCEVDAAEDAFAELARETALPEVRGTSAWMEVTR